MRQFLNYWKQQAAKLKIELYTLYLAYRDPRVPLYARIFAGCVVGYAFSPIDLIPDFIPIIGYLDDLLLVPLGIHLALLMIPQDVMLESRAKARDLIGQGQPVNRLAALFIISIWLLLAAIGILLAIRFFKP